MIQQRALGSKLLPAFALTIQVSLGSAVALAGGQATPQTPSAHSDSSSDVFADTRHEDASPMLHLAVGRSLVISTKTPLKRIYVGTPAVLQSYNSGPQEVVLTAKAYGVSSLVLWDTTGHSHMYTVSSEMDCDAVRAAFKSTFPTATFPSSHAKASWSSRATFPPMLFSMPPARWRWPTPKTLSMVCGSSPCMANRCS